MDGPEPLHAENMQLAKIAIALVVVPVACLAQSRDATLPESFYTGSLVLEYSLFGRGASGAKELRKLHDQGDWIALTKRVIEQRSLGYDVYYYYLAASAKNLGFNSAAKVFSDRALASADKCEDFALFDVCQGINVRRSIGVLLGTNRKPVESPSSEILGQLNNALDSPVGVGEIRLGNTVEQTLANDPSRSAWVVSSASRGEKLNDDIEVPGAEFVSARVATPLSGQPLLAELQFVDGRLIDLELLLGDGDLGASRLQSIKAQIESRFGAPKRSLDDMSTVRCVFGNANSYTLDNGRKSFSWSQTLKEGWFVVAELTYSAVGRCPDRSTEPRTESRTATYRVKVTRQATGVAKPLF